MTHTDLIERLLSVQSAARDLRSTTGRTKNKVLKRIAQSLLERKARILRANGKDMVAAKGATAAFRDRLWLTPARIDHMAQGVEQVARLSDPAGEVVERRILPNGLRIRKVRSPLGVVFMIFESRPNVAVEAFSLAFKSGNVVILKGGRESSHTTKILYEIIQEACISEGLSPSCVWGLDDPDRTCTRFLLTQDRLIDVVVPRGGESLIGFVKNHSRIPIIKNDRGLCHVYAHQDAQLKMAQSIVVNAKTQRPGVCNAMETLLVHSKIAPRLLPLLYNRKSFSQVEWVACPETLRIINGGRLTRAKPKSWDTEYLDLRMNCKIVESLEEAIEHIGRHGSKHSETVVTTSESAAKKFEAQVDAAVVYWNASTRFTDGFELGLGGELGISTQKLHVRGPVGLRELTSIRWIVEGTGQIRG